MDYSAAAAPAAGWPNTRVGDAAPPVMYGTVWDTTRVAGAGPGGWDIYRTRHIGSTAGTGFRLGWHSGSSPICGAMMPPQGTRRFIRFRHRYTPTTNFQCGSASCVHKYLLLGDTCHHSSGNPCRAILEMEGSSATREYRYRLAFDGGQYPARTGVYSPGQWHDIQLEVRSGTTALSNDGCFNIWVDNNNYAAPTATSGCNHPSTTGDPSMGWGYVQLGGFMNHGGHSPGDVYEYEDTGFEIDSVFDPSWHTGGTPPPPPPPSGSACDVNTDGSTNVNDVQLCANQAIGISVCTTGDINQDSSCNVIDVQRVVNAALGGQCVDQ